MRATIEVLASTPIKTSTTASLELQGLTGGSMILLSGTSETDPPLATDPSDDYPVIASVPSQLERLFQGAPALVEQVDMLVRQATVLLNTENRQAIAKTLQNMAAVSQNLAAAAPALEELLRTTNATMARIDRITAATEPDIKQTLAASAKTMRAAEGALGETETTMQAFGRTAGTVNSILEENRRPLRDFTHVTLYDVNSFIAELRELTISMRRVANELSRDPAGFIFGNQQRGYEAR